MAVAFLPGCITIYQPLTALQRPTVVDPEVANFKGQKILLRCLPGDYIGGADATRLCTRLESLFTAQGATVETIVPTEGFGTVDRDKGEARPDLIIELRSRLLHEDNPRYLWILACMTCLVLPAYTEYSFAQDISIRDAEGFELVSDTLQARFVRYTGLVTWVVNGSLDWLVRKPPEQISGDAAEKEFSRDFYRQVTQLAFNARVRESVLRSFDESHSSLPASVQAATPAPAITPTQVPTPAPAADH